MTQFVISLLLMTVTVAAAGRWAAVKQRRQREAAGATSPIDHPEVRHGRDHR